MSTQETAAIRHEELIQISGVPKRPHKKAKQHLAAWLTRNKITFVSDWEGWPVVSRIHFHQVMGAKALAGAPKIEPRLNMEAVNGTKTKARDRAAGEGLR